MSIWHEKTTKAAKGRWRGILMEFGIPEVALRDRHGPCPVCAGTDRFRWDNKDGSGSFICSVCGAGDGMKLAMLFSGLPFSDAAARVDAMLGNHKIGTDQIKPEMTEDERRRRLREVWVSTKPVAPGDLAHKYLAARGVDEMIYPEALRFGKVADGDGGIRPCMVAVVSDMDGKPATLHRTYLRPDGLAKAEMERPRMLMPGTLPDGAAVRLSGPATVLGVAEGIETAMSASALFGVPVWACISAGIMAKWIPPECCEEVVVFGDNDPGFAGQAAAYALARRVASGKRPLPVTVQIPKVVGTDWNDELAVWRGRRSVDMGAARA